MFSCRRGAASACMCRLCFCVSGESLERTTSWFKLPLRMESQSGFFHFLDWLLLLPIAAAAAAVLLLIVVLMPGDEPALVFLAAARGALDLGALRVFWCTAVSPHHRSFAVRRVGLYGRTGLRPRRGQEVADFGRQGQQKRRGKGDKVSLVTRMVGTRVYLFEETTSNLVVSGDRAASEGRGFHFWTRFLRNEEGEGAKASERHHTHCNRICWSGLSRSDLNTHISCLMYMVRMYVCCRIGSLRGETCRTTAVATDVALCDDSKSAALGGPVGSSPPGPKITRLAHPIVLRRVDDGLDV